MNESDVIKIPLADFNTILLHAEKISNGQTDFIHVLRGELKTKLGIDDADALIEVITNTSEPDINNITRLFLAECVPDLIVVGDDANYCLSKIAKDICELDYIDNPEVSTSPTTVTNDINPAKTLDQLATEINFNATQGDLHIKQGCLFYIEAGKGLIEAKKQVPYGEFQNWIKANCSFSFDTAQNYMKLADRYGELSNSQETESIRFLKKNLKPTQLLAMLALPEGEEENFLATKKSEGTPVEDMTVKKLREEIKRYKADAQKERQKINNLYADNSRLQAKFDAADKLANQYHVERDILQEQLDNQQPTVIEKTVTKIPDDYLANKATIDDLQDRIVELQEQLDNSAVPEDYETTKNELARLKAQQDTFKVDIACSQKITDLFMAVNFLDDHKDRLNDVLKNYLISDPLSSRRIEQLKEIAALFADFTNKI